MRGLKVLIPKIKSQNGFLENSTKCFVLDSFKKKKYIKVENKGWYVSNPGKIELKVCLNNNYNIRQNRF